MKGLQLSLGVIFLLFLTACQSNPSDIVETLIKTEDGIETATLAQVNMNSKPIRDLIDSISTGFYPNRHSLLIYKDDKLVLEKYFKGKDFLWGQDIGMVDHNDTTLHDVRSISKSVVSACIGIAIEQWKIKTVDDRVFNYFKEYDSLRDGGKEVITIKHLLTMTSGLEWNENISYDNSLAMLKKIYSSFH
jgi:CubicO group peptidase (beta-lactamase class C family)